MTEIAIPQVESAGSKVVMRRRAIKRFAWSDNFFRRLTPVPRAHRPVDPGGVIVSLIKGSLPAFQAFGLGFHDGGLESGHRDFGAGAPVFGTLVTSAIAMAIAVPLGIGIAIFLTELCPPSLRRPIGTAIELLAGIPSIIYGLWGLFVFAPFLRYMCSRT